MISTTYNQAINLALREILRRDENAMIWGPGANDPKRVFGTTNQLWEEFGEQRVFDGAISEASYTGHALGLALAGKHPIIHFQRIDFAFMAWDQIVNNIAKWNSMFGDTQKSLPIIIRTIQGRGWGQGQQHSQNPMRMLTSFPGLQVLTPSSPKQVYYGLLKAHQDKKPTLIYEHRWLQEQAQQWSPEDNHELFEEVSYFGDKDAQITFMSYSYGVVECLRAHRFLKERGIRSQVVAINQFDQNNHQRIQEAVNENQSNIIFDLAWESNSPLKDYLQLRESDSLQYITLKDQYTPTSVHRVKDYYPTFIDILETTKDMLQVDYTLPKQRSNIDQPIYDAIFNEEDA